MTKAGGSGRRQIVRAATIGALSLLVVVGVAHAVGADGRELSKAVSVLAHPWPSWILVSLLFEVASFLAYAIAQRRLIRAMGHRLSTRWLASLAVSAQALNNFLPAGYLAANTLNFRELRHRGLGSGDALWLLLASCMLYVGSLAILALLGSVLMGGQAAGATRYLAIGGVVVALALLVVLTWLAGRAVRFPAAPSLVAPQARFGSPADRAQAALRGLLASLAQIRVPWRTTGGALLVFTGCWLLDFGCLIASLKAVAAPLPWSSLLVAYAGAQLVSFLPVTPGGLGLVEGSLTVALTTQGVGAIHVLSGVLLYRAIGYWATLPAGAAGYAVVRRTRPATNAEARVASPQWPVSTASAAPSNT